MTFGINRDSLMYQQPSQCVSFGKLSLLLQAVSPSWLLSILPKWLCV